MNARYQRYFDRYCEYPILIDASIAPNTGIVVVIPCFNEPALLESLKALEACHKTQYPIEVIVIINASENASEGIKKQNEATFQSNKGYFKNSSLKVHFILKNDLPKKHAGVGLARKIGMDEAAKRFLSINKPEGIILCYDADTDCPKDYLEKVENYFLRNPNKKIASIHFEHPLEGNLPDENYNAIINYELHLRYYINIQKLIGIPHAYQTIGSSMAVRANAYVEQGGMNKRKAGEDFYFLHKYSLMDEFGVITSTHTIPSARMSDRVPFGTGKDIGDQLSDNNAVYKTYNPKSFWLLKPFIEQVDRLQTENPDQLKFDKRLNHFLEEIESNIALKRIRKQSTTAEQFRKHFFRWFDGFMVMKYAHFMRDHYFEDIELLEASSKLFTKMNPDKEVPATKKEHLMWFREYDKNL